MRISDTQFSQMMLRSLQYNNVGLGKVMQQMSTSDRLTKLSDDPMASVQLLNLSREGSVITQYKKNISDVKTNLSNQEVYLDSATESLQRIRELVLWGANGSLSTSDRNGMVTELNSLREGLITAFNAQDEAGHYLFSGTKTDTASIAEVSGSYVLQGNSDKRLVTVAKGVNVESNKTSAEILDLGGGDNILNHIDAIIAEFETPTANFRTEVETTLTAVDSTSAQVLGALTEIGGQIKNLEMMSGAHSENKLFVDKISNDLSALDYGEASVRLNNYMAALKATQASYTKINDLSLFDRL
ncbi:Flagellar hook-associated protein 3 [Vibrio aerogenes CECT 7868]|uniref:Flagellar hook-associated protein 3 n=1 Tax=Vibrio aerogenes CECT 7868 TaxID=1216006 RepID=A0A1M5YKY6_9VIBR|nr:flagellar hook-associated protein FlgL [Vibrio aerogenes]SHI12548.1 Flagellar hook-associated protein 3 [Vibrio aerogenes CECT 7868]